MALQIWTNEVDYVIAESAQEALECAIAFADCDDDMDDFNPLADDHEFTFWADWNDRWDNPSAVQTKTAAEWCATQPRGYFACSEY